MTEPSRQPQPSAHDSRAAVSPEAFAASAAQTQAKGFPVLPWSFMGVGLLVAWLCCTHLPGVFMYAGPDALARSAVNYGMRAGDIGAFLLVVAFSRRLGPLSGHPHLCVALIVACAVGTYAAPLLAGLSSDAGFFALCADSVVAGMGGAALFLLWAEVYSQLGNTRCLLFGAAGCVLAGAVSLLVSRLDPAAANVAIALLPLASGAAAALSLSRLPGEPAARVARFGQGSAACVEIAYPVPWKLVALMALAGFASGFAGSILVDSEGLGAVHRIVATTLSGAVLLATFFLRKGAVDVRLFAWATLPLAIVFFAMIPIFGERAGEAVSFLVKLAYVAFALFVLFMLANVCHRHDIPSARVFAAGRASSEAAMLAGILLRQWMRASGALDAGEMLWLIALIGLVATLGCVLLWHTERSVTSDWGVCGVDAAEGLPVESPRERLLGRVELLARAKGLTPREQEILALLAQGHEPAEIESELFLSHNTLKTHLRHIYAKLEVHTRAEALEMLSCEG